MKKVLVVVFLIGLSLWSPTSDAPNIIRPPEVIVAWDAPDPTDSVVGYRVHYGPESGGYTHTIDVGFQLYAILREGMYPGDTWFSAVTAYNSAGLESGYSNEISFTVLDLSNIPDGRKPIFKDFIVTHSALGDVSVSFKLVTDSSLYGSGFYIGETIQVYASDNLQDWDAISTIVYTGEAISIVDPAAKGKPRRFYRACRIFN